MDDFDKLLLLLAFVAMFKIELTIKSRDKLTGAFTRLLDFLLKR